MRRLFAVLCCLVLTSSTIAPIGLLGSTPLAKAAPSEAPDNPRLFTETGFSVSDDGFWDFFNKRGGLRTFGYPVSRKFTLLGYDVQFFQRRVMQKQPNGSVTLLNLLDPDVMPFTSINFARLPASNPALTSQIPAPGSSDYFRKVLSFVQSTAPNVWQNLNVNFYRTFNDTVKYEEAYPKRDGDPNWMTGINLEMWGVPTSAPTADPNNNDFVYQRFQRGVLHYDKKTGLTQGLLLADYLKSIITGQNLPADLDVAARTSRFYKQYNNGSANALNRPSELPNTNMKDAFEPDGGVVVPIVAPQPTPIVAPQPTPPPATAPTPTSGMRYGLQAHMLNLDRGQIYGATRDLGFGWLKQQIEWKYYEGSPGAIDWGQMDAIVNEARGNGITMLFSVVGAPPWAREPGHDGQVAGPPQDPQTFARFLGQMASRYCGAGLGAIEVWNEQNLHYEWGNKTISPADYMALLRPAYSSIKNACSSMIVVAGALTPTGAPAPLAMDDFTYLEGMYQNGLKDYADAVGVHPSGFNVPPSLDYTQACDYLRGSNSSFMGPCNSPHHSWSFRSSLDGYRDIMVRYGDGNKQLWATEFGWAAGGAFHPAYLYANDNTYEEQAAWTVEAYQYMRNSGFVGAAFLWNLNFRVIADRTEKAQWGIVTNQWQALPVYSGLKSMPK